MFLILLLAHLTQSQMKLLLLCSSESGPGTLRRMKKMEEEEKPNLSLKNLRPMSLNSHSTMPEYKMFVLDHIGL